MERVKKYIDLYFKQRTTKNYIVGCIQTHVMDELYDSLSQAEKNWLKILFPKNIDVSPFLYETWQLDFLIEIILEAENVPNYYKADNISLEYYKKEFPMPLLLIYYKGNFKTYMWQDYVENEEHKWVVRHDKTK